MPLLHRHLPHALKLTQGANSSGLHPQSLQSNKKQFPRSPFSPWSQTALDNIFTSVHFFPSRPPGTEESRAASFLCGTPYTQPLLTLVTSLRTIVCLSKKNESSQHRRIPTFSSCTGRLGQSQWDWSCTPSHLESFSECGHCLSSELSSVFREFPFSRITYADRCFIKCNKKPTKLIQGKTKPVKNIMLQLHLGSTALAPEIALHVWVSEESEWSPLYGHLAQVEQ